MTASSSDMSLYYNALKEAVKDLHISDDEIRALKKMQSKLKLSEEQVRACHAKMLAAAIIPFVNDDFLDDDETEKLDGLYDCFHKIGWAPGLKTKAQNTLSAATIVAVSCVSTIIVCLLFHLVLCSAFPSQPQPVQSSDAEHTQELDFGYKVIGDKEDYPNLWELDVELHQDFDKDDIVEIVDTITEKYRNRCEKNIVKVYSQNELLATINHQNGEFLNADFSGYISRQKKIEERNQIIKAEEERQRAIEQQEREKLFIAETPEKLSRSPSYTPSYSSGSSGYSSSSGGSVQVRGYYRKDGTYVRPYTRSKPKR